MSFRISLSEVRIGRDGQRYGIPPVSIVVAVKLGIEFHLTTQTRLCLLGMRHQVLLSKYHVQSITDISKQAAHAIC